MERLLGDLERLRSSWGEGEREADFGRSSFPFSIGDADRLRDFLLTEFSLEWLREPRSDLGFERLLERLLERDLRASDRERDLWLVERLRDFREWDRERDFLERDLAGDFEWDFLLDLERERFLLRDRELLRGTKIQVIHKLKT